MFSATVITGISMKCWCTIPMPFSIAAFGEPSSAGLPLIQDLALVGVVEAVDDVHQRRLAGAVLAEQRVHLALAQVEVDAVVRDDAGEALRDPAKLENGPLVHSAAILWPARAGGPSEKRRYFDRSRGCSSTLPAAISSWTSVHLRDEVGRHVGGDLAEPDAARGDVEDGVLAALRSCRPARPGSSGRRRRRPSSARS